MKELKGAIGIVFAQKNNQTYFLLLHRVLNWTGWEFPKGRLNEGEETHETVLREITEETNLKQITLVKKLDFQLKYKIEKENLLRVNDIFLVKANMNEPIILQTDIVEHDAFEWFTAKQVLFKIKFANLRKAFQKALKELKKYQ